MSHARTELAAAAARLIAEDGLDYAAAKRKAVQQVFGGARVPRDMLPGNEEIEAALREYQQLFQADTQPQRLRHLRQCALALMTLLEEFDPWLTGAVWNGTAGEHSQIRLDLYLDSGKEVAIFLLNQGLAFESGLSGSNNDEIETLRLDWQGEEALLFLYEGGAAITRRGATRNGTESKRGNRRAVLNLLQEDRE
ncbi:MAG: hypothetical protein EPO06_07405 [Burkholderiaceae bacterium]|nr:MAG: hypothetical protein EPO06_07405 [Burkholderiaceae bacterium]